jgi:YgiT-type zinc finger domain-containing protein
MSVRVRLQSSPSPLRLVRPSTGRPVDLDETQPVLLRGPRLLQPESVPVRCIRCDGRLERGTAPVDVERQGCRIALEALPAWVCTRCETPYFEEREVTVIRQALDLLSTAARTS